MVLKTSSVLEIIHFIFVFYSCGCWQELYNYRLFHLLHFNKSCNFDDGGNPVFLQSVTKLIGKLQWKSFALVFDDVDEADTDCFWRRLDLDNNSLMTLYYHYKGDNDIQMLMEIHRTLYPDINILMCCSFNSSLIRTAQTLDTKLNRTTDFKHLSHWLVVDLDESDDMLHPPVELTNIAVISKEFSFSQQYNAECTGMHLYTKHGIRGGAIFINVSTLSKDSIFPNLKYGYNNSTIIVSVVPFPPYVDKVANNGTVKYHGYSIDIVNALAKSLNFSYIIVEPNDQEWGQDIDGMGTWNGMVGQLQRREVDLTASDLTLHPERAKVMDYILPQIQTERVDVIYQKHEDLDSHWTMLFSFIGLEVFLAIALCIVIFPLIYVLVENSHQLNSNVSLCHVLRKKPFAERMDVCWFTVGSVLRQGGGLNPRSCANRILLSFWWLFVIVLTATYSAHFIANLSVKKVVQPFSSLGELLTNKDYTIGSTFEGITASLLENSTRDDIQQLLQRLKNQNDTLGSSMDFEGHLQNMKTSKYAAVAYDSVYGTYLSRDCSLEKLGADISYEPLGFGVPKGSPMKHDIERAMWVLLENGLLEDWWQKWSNRSSDSCDTKTRETRGNAITLNRIGGGFVIVSSGVLFAGATLMLEMLVKRYEEQRRSK